MVNPTDLLTKSYFYELPPELIAERPISLNKNERSESKLFVYHHKTGQVIHDKFKNIGNYLPSDARLVFNQSKVFPSRLLGQKNSGGLAEIFLLSLLGPSYSCLIKSNGRKKRGDEYFLPEKRKVIISELGGDGTFKVDFYPEFKSENELMNYLERHALIPIPPYIRKGVSDHHDKETYQTIYAKDVGSVAAPTAGLHFTPDLKKALFQDGREEAFVTLHVGIGTFRPVNVESLSDHQMHREEFFVSADNLKKIREKKPTIAVGTTTLRVLESLHRLPLEKAVPDHIYETSIFLHPGIDVQSIQGLITNFHLPESSLLILVSALIGREKTLELYRVAIENKYRFFSYGDAMLILL